MRAVTKTWLVLMMWSFAHYAAVHLYEYWCTPLTAIGFFMSPVMVNTPHCVAFRWLIHNGAFNIVESWSLIAGFAIACIVQK